MFVATFLNLSARLFRRICLDFKFCLQKSYQFHNLVFTFLRCLWLDMDIVVVSPGLDGCLNSTHGQVAIVFY